MARDNASRKTAQKKTGNGRRSRWHERKGSASREFRYIRTDGTEIKNRAELKRIKSLVIPPAWKYVRINPAPGGKVQAVGMDINGRVQYIYHTAFAETRRKKKFARIIGFGETLPRFKRKINHDIALEGVPLDKVLAIAMRLINSLYFRVGSEQSAKQFKTYGLTTLQKRHLEIGRAGKLIFRFTGKSHVAQRRILVDPELAAAIKEMMSIKRGRKLFRFTDETGKARPITSAEINRYIKRATGGDYSSKDFRTWGGTFKAAVGLAEFGPCKTQTERKKAVVSVVKKVAAELGNTPAVCRDSYIHPAVLKAYEKGVTLDEYRPRRTRKMKSMRSDILPEERALVKLLKDFE